MENVMKNVNQYIKEALVNHKVKYRPDNLKVYYFKPYDYYYVLIDETVDLKELFEYNNLKRPEADETIEHIKSCLLDNKVHNILIRPSRPTTYINYYTYQGEDINNDDDLNFITYINKSDFNINY